MAESSAWRTVVSATDAMPHGLKGFAMAAVSVGGLALVSHVAKRAMSRGDKQCSKSLIMESSSTKSAHRPYSKQDIPDVLGKAISEDLLGLNKEEVAIFFDMDSIKEVLTELHTVFPPHFVHTFAIKSCPLPALLRFIIQNGHGMESASIAELMLAIRCGCPPDKLMFDSPAKTSKEIRDALVLGVQLNVDNFDELARVAEALKQLESKGKKSTSTVALRFNPMVGSGSIAALSVSTNTSKFALPFNNEVKERIISSFKEHTWIKGLHIHVGSQGMSLDQLAQGASIAVKLADEIDDRVGRKAVQVLDIGGGVPLNYSSFELKPTFGEYAALLRKRVPDLFSKSTRTVITEFGRSVCGKSAWTACCVEYVKRMSSSQDVAIIQAGADLFMRTCYQPSNFALRIGGYSKKDGMELKTEERKVDVAGPLCFAGDKIATQISLPSLTEGDVLVVHDTGANTLSTFSRHCSRSQPVVYGYTRLAGGGLKIKVLKPRESIDEVLRSWGVPKA